MTHEEKQALAEDLLAARITINNALRKLHEQPAAEPVRKKQKPLTFSDESKERQEREKAENGG